MSLTLIDNIYKKWKDIKEYVDSRIQFSSIIDKEVTDSDLSALDSKINKKQDKLKAGKNITIQNNVISSTSKGKTYVPGQNIGIDNTTIYAKGYVWDEDNQSFAEGTSALADGESSHAEGVGTQANRLRSHAEGYATQANNIDAHAEGANTRANGQSSHAEGDSTTAWGQASHAEGQSTSTGASFAHAEGNSTTANGSNSHAEGGATVAEGESSHAEGLYTTASGSASHAEGYKTQIPNYNTSRRDTDSGNDDYGKYAHAEGNTTTACGHGSHAEGVSTLASGHKGSHAEGCGVIASGSYSHAEGYYTSASNNSSHAEGYNTSSSNQGSHAEGDSTTASGYASHAEGRDTESSGSNSHAEGQGAIASGISSHAEGGVSRASGFNSHAEGESTTASGQASHAEGYVATASGQASHAEGYNTTASRAYSHAEGYNTTSSGQASHAEGYNTTASRAYSHAEGLYTITNNEAEHAQGKYNKSNSVPVPQPIEYVDMGTSVLWAKWNLGATSETEYGDYYAWGETEPKSSYTWENYKWGNPNAGGLTKYNATDGKTVLDPEDDAAHVNLGGGWRMPTREEVQELISNCTYSWQTNYRGSGVNGGLFTAQNGNTLFIPNAGMKPTTSDLWTIPGNAFYCFSNSLFDIYNGNNISGFLNDGWMMVNSANRCNGISIHPVISRSDIPEPSNTIHSTGIGTADNRKNAVEVMDNGDVYVIGLGGYDGTNPESAQTLQQVIASLVPSA